MLSINFQGHQSTTSREEGFKGLTMDMADVLVMRPGAFEQIFVSSAPGGSI